MTLETDLVDPTLTDTRAPVSPAPRPAVLNGARLALLANGKTHGDALLEFIADLLTERYGAGPRVRITKQHPSEPPSAEEFELLRGCDVALSAIGDCGSCSSCTVVDGINLEQAGIPTAVLITAPFRATTTAIAALNGAPWFEPVFVPHPVTSLDRAGLRERAEEAFDAVVAALLGSTRPGAETGPAPTAATLTAEAVENALADYRAGLQTDGADLRAESIEDGNVTLRLTLADTTCGDCIMPAPILASVATKVLQERFGSHVAAVVVDGRDDRR
ncbi:hypothetical protein DMP23_43450 [Amycolatopsis sp. A1MSW2902]|uniref:UGSC family (seleno)protein n=1 Tax=Amycolatopsis sp. A1MSW2902 TaxID=687413 RepID=UPI00307EEF9A